MIGELLKLFAAFNRLGQGVGLVSGNSPAKVLAVLPNLVFEIRPLVLAGISLGGAVFLLKRTVFHALDLLHLLENLLPFVSERIHGQQLCLVAR